MNVTNDRVSEKDPHRESPLHTTCGDDDCCNFGTDLDFLDRWQRPLIVSFAIIAAACVAVICFVIYYHLRS